MKPEEILIVPKDTKFEWDQIRLGLTPDQVIAKYKEQGLSLEKILGSHKRQKETLGKIGEILDGATFVARDNLTREIAHKYKLVIAFGGDNHFEYVSQFIDNGHMLGINSDYQRSEGALTTASANQLEEILPLLLEDRFLVEQWTRLAVKVDDKPLTEQAISEIFIGEERRYDMSRHIIKLNDVAEEQKGSGLVISTGAGSTGWYKSGSRYLFPEGNVFPKTDKKANFVLTEPYTGRILSGYKLEHGSIHEGEELEVTSLSDAQASLGIGNYKRIPLHEGARIKVRLGSPLNVVRFENRKVYKSSLGSDNYGK